jgi:hypothetical protein
MPLHVDIRVNDHLINTLHIGRLSGDTSPDSINSYKVVEGEMPDRLDKWLVGTDFEHRYGDGAEVCVMKAIQAITEGAAKP